MGVGVSVDLVVSLITVQVSSKIGVKKGEKTNTLIPQKSTVQVFTLELSYNLRKTEPMKILLTIFTLLFSTVMFSSPSHAGWTKVGESVSGSIYYVDFERIKKDGGYLYFWRLRDYLKPDKYGHLSSKKYIQVDCLFNWYKGLSWSWHKEPMGGGAGRTNNDPDEEWNVSPPDSIIESILKSVCSR